MKLYDISEPDHNNPDDSAKQEELVVGIDLGTTNSLIAISQNQIVSIIKDENTNKSFIPSVVAYLGDRAIVGQSALDSKCAYIASIKRLMGKGKEDVAINFPHPISNEEGIIKLKVNDMELTPIEISAEILKSLKKNAENYLKKPVTQAVITVPAYFDDAARQATKDAAMLAGIKVLRLVNEPTAAAIAYGFDQRPEGLYAIYDLGGGTFDISVLKLHQGIFHVLATGGDTNLGGDDFDNLLLNYFQHAHNIKIVDALRAKEEARAIREALTDQSQWHGTFQDVDCNITTDEFNQLIKPLIDRTIKLLKACIRDADIEVSELKEILLVGGATRTPLVKHAINQAIGKAPLDKINPDEIVAVGAALQAEALSVGSNNLLIDVIPLSLGIEVANGIVEHLLSRNTAIPAVCTQVFTTQSNNQTGIKIHILQGESNEVSKCRSLARFELKNLPALNAGELRIEVSFQVDADGILTVKAKDLFTSKMQEVLVKPSYGLSEEEIKKLLNI